MKSFDLVINHDKEVEEAAEILVDGVIGGRTYRFLFDTGANITRVRNDDYINRFESQSSKDTYGIFSKMKNEQIIVPKLALGPIEKIDFQMYRYDKESPAHNIIGMDFLHDHSYFFNFVENNVEVDKQGFDELEFFDLQIGNKVKPYVDVYVEDTKVRAIWDTGAGITVVDSRLVEKYPKSFKAFKVVQGTDSTGSSTETPMYLMESMIIGNKQFPSLKVISIDLSSINAKLEKPMDIILGYNCLNKANWLFDFPNKKWTIVKMN
jgi:predicted aspartyl protease